MQRKDFSYELPPELIAARPCAVRSASRLLCIDPPDDRFEDRRFSDFPDLLRPHDVVVFNNTRVIPARLLGNKETGGSVEVLVERITAPRRALAHIRASKSPRAGSRLHLAGALRVEVTGRAGELFELSFPDGPEVLDLLTRYGHVPLPPYIGRPDEAADHERYQTVYADKPGAVAAPTAGLHFDTPVLQRLAERGIASAFVTLHVGAGTFQPVRVDNLDEHVMHREYFEIDQAARDRIDAARRHGGRVIAIGTTVVRTLESAFRNGRLEAGRGETALFIRPGYRFRVADALLTNFHLPESTLLMLVCAFAGQGRILRAYRHAIDAGYRFFSYGDAMFISARDDTGMDRGPA
ncbi:MAG: tRNA preQ1(34) S-adenosylmethionine ribosyltransferase-isomerase QueA [Gammaproteobacteria bacterium]|jgi:S-adenosylmethionine:tRNA ribosyltransferase-isomerase